MLRKEIAELLESADSIYTTKILKQHWKESKYSYLTQPRPDFGLILLLGGRIDFVTDRGTLSARAGNVIFLPKGCRYEARFPHEADDYLVSFDMEGPHPAVSAPIKLLEEASFPCVEAFRLLVEENFPENHTRLRSQGLFYLLLDAIVGDTKADNMKNRGLVDRARELIRKNGEASVADIAKECAICESGFRRIFKEQMGITPARYRLEMKLRHAAYLLESTELSVNEIAERLNFYDAAYFCKVFRAHIGMTPGQYAQNKKL